MRQGSNLQELTFNNYYLPEISIFTTGIPSLRSLNLKVDNDQLNLLRCNFFSNKPSYCPFL